jgi:hypothetical protein
MLAVRKFAEVESLYELLLDEALDDIVGGGNDVITSGARFQFSFYLFIRATVLFDHIDAVFLLKVR